MMNMMDVMGDGCDGEDAADYKDDGYEASVMHELT